MSRSLALVLVCLPACLGLTACSHRSESAAGKQSYIRIEPAGKAPAKEGLAMQQGASEEQVGLAFYKGARVNKSGLIDGPRGHIAAATLQSGDAYADVAAFYLKKYAAHKPQVVRREEATGPVTMLNWQDLRGNYTVMIKRDQTRKCTVITLARTST